MHVGRQASGVAAIRRAMRISHDRSGLAAIVRLLFGKLLGVVIAGWTSFLHSMQPCEDITYWAGYVTRYVVNHTNSAATRAVASQVGRVRKTRANSSVVI
jgi:hypothetical protein